MLLGGDLFSLSRGSESRRSCHNVFALWKGTEQRPAYRPGQRSTVKITAVSFSEPKTQTEDRWRLILNLSVSIDAPSEL